VNRVLVIGFGNTLRGDDGAGIRAATGIRAALPSVDTLCVHSLQPELAEAVAEYETVVFLDASVGVDTVTLTLLDACPSAARVDPHTSSPAAIVSLAAQVYGRTPANVLLVEIPAAVYEYGETLSPATAEAVRQCVNLVCLWAGAAGAPEIHAGMPAGRPVRAQWY